MISTHLEEPGPEDEVPMLLSFLILPDLLVVRVAHVQQPRPTTESPLMASVLAKSPDVGIRVHSWAWLLFLAYLGSSSLVIPLTCSLLDPPVFFSCSPPLELGPQENVLNDSRLGHCKKEREEKR